MKIPTSELTGDALNWAVCLARRPDADMSATHVWLDSSDGGDDFLIDKTSTDWALGGPIIEREKIGVAPMTSTVGDDRGTSNWFANHEDKTDFHDGPTPLIAAMRCYVASKLGNTVNIPDELTKESKHERR